MGSTGVALRMHGPWVYGVLINNQWSVADWGDKAVTQMLLQWFLNYNFPGAFYLASSPIITANWNADRAGDIWRVPLGGGVGKLFRLDDVFPLEVSFDCETASEHSAAGVR